MKTYFNIFYSFTLLFISTIVFGQETLVSLGGNLALPQSAGLKMVAGTGVGGSLRLERYFGKHTSGIATVEYLKFGEKTSRSQTTKFAAIPVQVGIKYYPGKEQRVAKGFFISGEIGLMLYTTYFAYPNRVGDFKFKERDLSVAPGLGYQFGRAEASFRPLFSLNDAGFNVYYLDFRLAYTFLKKKKT